MDSNSVTFSSFKRNLMELCLLLYLDRLFSLCVCVVWLALFLHQINGQCSCFQSIDLLKSRPAHLAVFLHHVVSQFDPVPLVHTDPHTHTHDTIIKLRCQWCDTLTVFRPLQLCYLYADMHKQTSSKESRRFFMEFHSLFMDRTAVSHWIWIFSISPSVSFPLDKVSHSIKYFVSFLFQNLKVPVPETIAAELGMKDNEICHG